MKKRTRSVSVLTRREAQNLRLGIGYDLSEHKDRSNVRTLTAIDNGMALNAPPDQVGILVDGHNYGLVRSYATGAADAKYCAQELCNLNEKLACADPRYRFCAPASLPLQSTFQFLGGKRSAAEAALKRQRRLIAEFGQQADAHDHYVLSYLCEAQGAFSLNDPALGIELAGLAFDAAGSAGRMEPLALRMYRNALVRIGELELADRLPPETSPIHLPRGYGWVRERRFWPLAVMTTEDK